MGLSSNINPTHEAPNLALENKPCNTATHNQLPVALEVSSINQGHAIIPRPAIAKPGNIGTYMSIRQSVYLPILTHSSMMTGTMGHRCTSNRIWLCATFE